MSSFVVFEPSKIAYIGLAVTVVVWLVYILGKIRATRQLRLLADFRHFGLIIPGHSRAKSFIKMFIYSVAILFLSVCLFRPKWGKKPQEVVQESRNVMIALDMSRSMMAKDFLPNRLEFIKLKLRILLEKLGPERVGLILFSDKAFIHCPFTSDFNAFFSFLEQADPQTISSGGTDIAKALREAVSCFKNLPSEGSNKLLFLITDGEDFSPNVEESIKLAKANNLKVFTVGAATVNGAPVPILDKAGKEIGHEKSKGGVVMTKLNEEFLRSMSDKLGGEFIRVTSSDADVEIIAKKIDAFEKERMGDRQANLYKERQNIFSALFMLMIIFEWFL